MPYVQISLPVGEALDTIQSICDATHGAMVETIDVPQHDRFITVTNHGAGMMDVDPVYLDVERSERALIIRITMKSGRTPAMKRALYHAIVRNVTSVTDFRKEDVMIVLSENELIDWSFGNGDAQIATRD